MYNFLDTHYFELLNVPLPFSLPSFYNFVCFSGQNNDISVNESQSFLSFLPPMYIMVPYCCTVHCMAGITLHMASVLGITLWFRVFHMQHNLFYLNVCCQDLPTWVSLNALSFWFSLFTSSLLSSSLSNLSKEGMSLSLNFLHYSSTSHVLTHLILTITLWCI